MEHRSCSVVAGACMAPANGPPAARHLATCYVCGEDVCRSPYCSCLHTTERPVGTGRVRTRRPVRTCARCLADRYGQDHADVVLAEASGDADQAAEVSRRIDERWAAAQQRRAAEVAEGTRQRIRQGLTVLPRPYESDHAERTYDVFLDHDQVAIVYNVHEHTARRGAALWVVRLHLGGPLVVGPDERCGTRREAVGRLADKVIERQLAADRRAEEARRIAEHTRRVINGTLYRSTS